MRGAPIISGTPGTQIAALDAFLLHGWGQVSASQIVVASGVATATVNAGDTFEVHAVIEVAGATQAAINGQARVTGGTVTTVTWASDAPDGTYTGAITIKYAPVGGWQKAFSKANVAVYRSIAPESPRMFFRVDDTGTLSARVRGYIDMTDVDTGIGPFPTEAQIAGGGYWVKSGVASAAAAQYVMAADSRAMLVCIASRSMQNASHTGSPARGFGDMLPLAPGGDPWAVALSCAGQENLVSIESGNGGFEGLNSGAAGIYVARSASGGGAGVMVAAMSYSAAGRSGTIYSGNDALCGVFPSTVDGVLRYCRKFIYQDNSTNDRPPRADVPGVLYIPQSGVVAAINRLDVVEGAGAFAGRALLALHCTAVSLNSNPGGVYLIDITGPWR